MKIFITGATGFIGRHVMGQIQAAGHDILASTLEKDADEGNSKGIKWIYGNLRNLDHLKPAIKYFNPDIVIHLAWQGIPDYSEVISTINLNNSIQLLDFILEETNCQKIIVSGSCFEYGKKKGACKESDRVKINSFFSWAKYSLYQYLSLKCKRKSVDLVWFRIFYVYGPGQRGGSLIPTLVQALINGKTPDIRSPLNKNDFIYVEDVSRAFRLAADMKIKSGIYNLGYGTSNRVYDICKIAENRLISSIQISRDILRDSSKEQSVNFWANMNKTTSALNWAPKTTFEQGIANYIKLVN